MHFDFRVDKKRDKLERKVLDSQERAFWDVHRPVVSRILSPYVYNKFGSHISFSLIEIDVKAINFIRQVFLFAVFSVF